MDLTPIFWKCVSSYMNERTDLLPPIRPSFPKPLNQLKDPYLIEAHQISESIMEVYKFGVEVQKGYLGLDPTQTYTTSEKEAIDTKCALMIAQCRASIQSLELDLLGSSKSSFFPTKQQQRPVYLQTHYTSVIQQLQQRLLHVSNAHQRLQSKRLEYELDNVLSIKDPTSSTSSAKTKKSSLSSTEPLSILPLSKVSSSTSSSTSISTTTSTSLSNLVTTSTTPLASSELSQQQQLQLESENQSLLQRWLAPLEEVQKTESSLLAISQIQAELAQHLASQQVTLEHVWEEAGIQTEHVNEGNKQLTQVLETGRGRRLWFLILVLVLSFLLLFLDWYHDRLNR